MCCLYSVLNLLIIQHVETLYLGGNNVRIVCERVWRNSRCVHSRESHDWQVAKVAYVWSMQGAKGSRQLEYYRTNSIVWPGSYLATQTRDSFQSRGQVAKMPYLDENWLFTFLTYPTINTLIPTKCKCGYSERKTLREVSTIHPPH